MRTITRAITRAIIGPIAGPIADIVSRLVAPGRRLAAAMRMLCRWADRHGQRRALGELDDRLLDDVGLTRAQADAERRKPFWR